MSLDSEWPQKPVMPGLTEEHMHALQGVFAKALNYSTYNRPSKPSEFIADFKKAILR
jgi:predicted amidohydrolase YtcJ